MTHAPVSPSSLWRRAGLALISGTAILGLAACSSSGSGEGSASSSAAGASGSAEAATSINIVTSTTIWGDVASAVADTAQGVDITVEPIVQGNGMNPHDFEPTASDMAKVEEADFVVVGGRGYDAWLYDTLDEDTVVHALPLTEHDHSVPEGATDTFNTDLNEHVWYDVDAVADVAGQVADKINEANPDADASAEDVDALMDELRTRIEALPALRVAQTEPIADFLIEDSQLEEVTPSGYRATTLAESEPSAADLDSFLQAIDAREMDILIYNPQTETDLSERIRDAAEAAGIPIVEMSETPADGEHFFEFFSSALDRLEAGAADAA